MNRDPVAIAAVRAATGRASGTLRVESRREVVAGDGSSWNVETPPFRGLMAAADPVVLVVAPPGMDELDAPVWVGEIHGKGFVRLDAEASLAAFFAAYPELPCETRVRLIAINLGPRGAERVLFEDEEVESLLE